MYNVKNKSCNMTATIGHRTKVRYKTRKHIFLPVYSGGQGVSTVLIYWRANYYRYNFFHSKKEKYTLSNIS